MAKSASRLLSRRRLLASLALVSQAAAAPKPPVVTVLWDSITAGLGLPVRVARPALLLGALPRRGGAATVGGGGVSGDTSGGGLARVGFSVAADTAVCVVALGGNDLLQGVEPAQTKANLRGILQKLEARGVGTVLVGVAAPASIGAAYAREFNAVYPDLARAFGAPLQANILEGVRGNPALMQRDGVHPNAAGARKIAEGLAPLVARALKARKRA